jgi:glycosyltransferase involved in cell wall biosynthesis
MTIIQVMHSHTAGSVERHVVHLSEALAARGHRVYLACPNRGWLWDAVQGTCVTPFHLPMDGLQDMSSVDRLTRLVRRVDAEILHAHMTRAAFYAAKVGHRTRVPVIASAHAAIACKHYGGTDRVLCASEAVKEALARYDVPDAKMRIVYPGIPAPRSAVEAATVARLRQAWAVPPGGWAVGMLARLLPEAGIETLLAVAARWKTERPGVRFVVAGPGDETVEQEMRALASAMGVRETVSFIGLTESAADVLAACDVLASPARREASPLILLEAMAAGTPIVATEVGTAPELILDGVTGILVCPEDPDALSAGLSRALDGEEIAGMVAAARRRVQDRFSLTRVVSEVEDNYKDLAVRE